MNHLWSLRRRFVGFLGRRPTLPLPEEGLALHQGLQVPRKESRMWARELARLGGACVFVGFICLFSKGLRQLSEIKL